MFVESLRNRIRAMNVLWERAISDMTLEQVNHHGREGVLPVGPGIVFRGEMGIEPATLCSKGNGPISP